MYEARNLHQLKSSQVIYLLSDTT